MRLPPPTAISKKKVRGARIVKAMSGQKDEMPGTPPNPVWRQYKKDP